MSPFFYAHPESVSGMSEIFHYECHSCPSQMSAVRSRIRKSAIAFGFDEHTVGHLVLAVDEACTNIIRYAYDGKTDEKIEIDVTAKGDMWEVRLRDYGRKADPTHLKGRELHEVRPGGLGLFFISQAFDEVHFDHSLEEGTCLVLRKRKITEPIRRIPKGAHKA